MKKTSLILGACLLPALLGGCTTSTDTSDTVSTGNMPTLSSGQTGPIDFPAEAKALIDQIMAAKQQGDTATEAKIQAELDAKFPNLPKPGQNANGVMPANGQSSLDTSFVTTKFLDVAYANDSASQKMDIYLPEGTGPFPVIIAIHGGAFMMGSKDAGDVASMIKAVKKGYAVVSVNYRLSPEAKFPAAINDIQSAILFVKNNAKQYNLNPNKIATWGGSAGGHLSALAGTMGDKTKNTQVQAVVDRFGPIYFSTMDTEFAALGLTPKMGATNTTSSPETKYLGQTIGTVEAEPLVKQASPQTYISKDDPAFFIQHGNADTNIPLTQSQNFSKALTSVLGANKVTFDILEGAGHGGSQFDDDANLEKVFAFLDTYLK